MYAVKGATGGDGARVKRFVSLETGEREYKQPPRWVAGKG